MSYLCVRSCLVLPSVKKALGSDGHDFNLVFAVYTKLSGACPLTSQFLHLRNGNDNDAYLIRLQRRLSELIQYQLHGLGPNR